MSIDEFLLEILACPVCRGGIEHVSGTGDAGGILCARCALVYPVRNDIPVMLKEEAVSLEIWNSRQLNAKGGE